MVSEDDEDDDEDAPPASPFAVDALDTPSSPVVSRVPATPALLSTRVTRAAPNHASPYENEEGWTIVKGRMRRPDRVDDRRDGCEKHGATVTATAPRRSARLLARATPATDAPGGPSVAARPRVASPRADTRAKAKGARGVPRRDGSAARSPAGRVDVIPGLDANARSAATDARAAGRRQGTGSAPTARVAAVTRTKGKDVSGAPRAAPDRGGLAARSPPGRADASPALGADARANAPDARAAGGRRGAGSGHADRVAAAGTRAKAKGARGAPISYALRTSRDSENFHAGAAAQILFMEPDTAGDFHIAPASCAREAHMGFMNPVVGLLTT